MSCSPQPAAAPLESRKIGKADRTDGKCKFRKLRRWFAAESWALVRALFRIFGYAGEAARRPESIRVHQLAVHHHHARVPEVADPLGRIAVDQHQVARRADGDRAGPRGPS